MLLKQYIKTLLRGLEVLYELVFMLKHMLSMISHSSPFLVPCFLQRDLLLLLVLKESFSREGTDR